MLIEHWIRAKYEWKEFHAETTQIPVYLKGILIRKSGLLIIIVLYTIILLFLQKTLSNVKQLIDTRRRGKGI